MQPNNPTSPEQAPLPTPSVEQGTTLPGVEQAPPSQERVAPPSERPSQGGDPGSGTLPAPAPPTVMPKADTALDTPAPPPPPSGPAIADDVDVIEKEWVQKAKTIVNEHKHDPYTQEKETSKLQADYLKKRYGKEVKTSD